MERSTKIHKNKYDYSLSKYEGGKDKICIICPKHGKFYQTPSSHLRGSGCFLCRNKRIGDSRRINTEEFIKRAIKIHGTKYNYAKVVYVSFHKKVTIVCKKHGDFLQTPANHLHGFVCRKCSVENRAYKCTYTTREFIKSCKLVHGSRYSYTTVRYTGIYNKIDIICKKHGIFSQRAHDHLSGCGCPTCRKSKGEIRIEKWLKLHKIKFIYEHTFSRCKDKQRLSFDFFLPNFNMCIEFDGEQHFYPSGFGSSSDNKKIFKRIKKHDNIKNKFCENNGIKILRISYKDFDKIDAILNNYIKTEE